MIVEAGMQRAGRLAVSEQPPVSEQPLRARPSAREDLLGQLQQPVHALDGSPSSASPSMPSVGRGVSLEGG